MGTLFNQIINRQLNSDSCLFCWTWYLLLEISNLLSNFLHVYVCIEHVKYHARSLIAKAKQPWDTSLTMHISWIIDHMTITVHDIWHFRQIIYNAYININWSCQLGAGVLNAMGTWLELLWTNEWHNNSVTIHTSQSEAIYRTDHNYPHCCQWAIR